MMPASSCSASAWRACAGDVLATSGRNSTAPTSSKAGARRASVDFASSRRKISWAWAPGRNGSERWAVARITGAPAARASARPKATASSERSEPSTPMRILVMTFPRLPLDVCASNSAWQGMTDAAIGSSLHFPSLDTPSVLPRRHSTRRAISPPGSAQPSLPLWRQGAQAGGWRNRAACAARPRRASASRLPARSSLASRPHAPLSSASAASRHPRTAGSARAARGSPASCRIAAAASTRSHPRS